MFTNINIKEHDASYQYIIEYIKGGFAHNPSGYISGMNIDAVSYISDIVLVNGDKEYVKNHNTWNEVVGESSNTYLPLNPTGATIRLYFPEYSVDTYRSGAKYALSVGTWINGKYISLSSHIVERLDAVACNRPKRFCDQTYHECIEFQIVDPFTLMYSDIWKDFRVNVCGEPTDPKLVNSTDSMLYLSLHVVKESSEGEYEKVLEFDGGQNTLSLTKDPKNYFNLNVSVNTDENLDSDRPAVILKADFNEVYAGDIQEYIYETYGIENCEVQYGLAIGNENDIYATLEGDWVTTSTYSFSKDDIFESSRNFTSGDGYKCGMFIVGSINISGDDESLIYKLSNKLPFTPELFRYFVNSAEFEVNGYTVNSVNLDEIDMEVLNINAVNKIENRIVQVAGTQDAKSNVIQPVFYRSVEASDVVLHAGVIENVCINLDRYKSMVETFYIQVGENVFAESGRIHSGVLFKINGKSLTKSDASDTYYVLNESREVVTYGKYTVA